MADDTLDPPGRIAILGGGPVGLEAALYGRYLGYSVVLFEAGPLVPRLLAEPDQTPPPNCTSPLGRAAVAAQRGLGGTSVELQPATNEEWAREYFERIAGSDLLTDRVRRTTTVERLEWVPEDEADQEEPEQEDSETEEVNGDELEEDAEDEGPLPPDFLVHFVDAWGVAGVERVEAVIDARGKEAAWIGPGEESAETPAYLYRLGTRAAADTDYRGGLIQIRQLFAALRGRPELDVYANLGGEV